MTAFRLAHLSDPHLGPLPAARPSDLASKRILGYLNWHRNRSRQMGADALAALTEDLAAEGADHLAVTGDLVNIALPEEYVAAAAWLASLGPAEAVSVVPGNHDAYVAGGLERALSAWAPFMRGDDAAGGEAVASERFPFVRVRGPVAIVGASSAVPTAPFWATGTFDEAQASRLARHLGRLGARGLFRVVLIHHPPVEGMTGRRKRLVGARRFREAVAAEGAELVLHGHTHEASVTAIDGPGRKVPVVGVPSASAGDAHAAPARYTVFEIAPAGGGFSLRMLERGARGPGEPVAALGERILSEA